MRGEKAVHASKMVEKPGYGECSKRASRYETDGSEECRRFCREEASEMWICVSSEASRE
jgi:hypothetical protein